MAVMPLPRLDQYADNVQQGTGDATSSCVVCGRPVERKTTAIDLVESGIIVVVSYGDPLLHEAQESGTYLGSFPVGWDCLENNPDLRAFAREVLTPAEDIYLGPSGPMDNYGSLE